VPPGTLLSKTQKLITRPQTTSRSITVIYRKLVKEPSMLNALDVTEAMVVAAKRNYSSGSHELLALKQRVDDAASYFENEAAKDTPSAHFARLVIPWSELRSEFRLNAAAYREIISDIEEWIGEQHKIRYGNQ